MGTTGLALPWGTRISSVPREPENRVETSRRPCQATPARVRRLEPRPRQVPRMPSSESVAGRAILEDTNVSMRCMGRA